MNTEKNDEIITFKVVDELGNIVECEVLFTFEEEDTGNSYVVYTDNTNDTDGNTKVFASMYDPVDKNKLLPIKDEEVWVYIENILEILQSGNIDDILKSEF